MVNDDNVKGKKFEFLKSDLVSRIGLLKLSFQPKF